MKKKRMWIIGTIIVLAAIVILIAWQSDFRYAYVPDRSIIKNSHRPLTGFDQNGNFIAHDQADHLLTTDDKGTTVKVDDRLLKLGKTAFYKETFGNEVFLTDIMGILDGPLTFKNLMKAIIALHGEGTSNLRVELASDFKAGGRVFHKGEKIDTGIDVPKGAYAPLGMPIRYDHGKVRVGISCAACHATVDRLSKNVIEGAPNNDLNLGVMMALASNTATYFTHAQINSIRDFITDRSKTVTTSDGKKAKLPDPDKLEAAVDSQLIRWPRGNFDSIIDMKASPSQIPDAFTKGDFPYGWSGFAQAGPFHGLSVFSNNVHAQNTDPLSQADVSRALFGIDKEVYIGTILQRAANPKFRYDTDKMHQSPSAFFAKVDPTPGVAGINQLVKNPAYPKMTPVAPDGLIASSPGTKVNEENNAMAAWQNTIVPPKAPIQTDEKTVRLGRKVFMTAGCMSCHVGKYLTNHRIIPVQDIGTDPVRAAGLKKTENQFGKALQYTVDTPVPVPKNASVVRVPDAPLGWDQLKLGFAHGKSAGGYKVPSLNGLYWTAPYLHDGGVAVGKNAKTELGLPGTVNKNIPVDPANSLRALVDRQLRAKVVDANKKGGLGSLHVTGSGHSFWVDEEAGFTKEQQEALIQYLLSLTK